MPQYNYETGQMEETDEERRAREEAEKRAGTTVVGETRVKQYEDGSQTETVTKEIAAPVAPPPDATFNRMIQAESGGRQTNAQGQVLTSPKGALGIAQVMPTTAMDPGYGVKNIFDLAQQRGVPFQNRDQATAEQLLGNRALNQEFGQNYYAAMNRRFDGGPAAVAAYNAGPGRVQQNMAQNQGQLNVGQLPQETQGYLQKVGMPMPQAQPQAQPRPPQPVSPEQLAQQPMPANQGINVARPGLQIPGLTPVAQMPAPVDTTAQAIDRYQSIQDKPDELMKFAFDDSTPAYLKQRAKDQIVQQYDQQKKLAQAETEAPNLTPKQVADAIQGRNKTGTGDWLQYLLLKHVGLNDLANQKGEQLGIGHVWTRSSIVDQDGKNVAVEVQTTASGKLLGGNRLDGTPLTRTELNQTGTGLGKGTSLSADVYVDPTTGQRYRSGFDNAGNTALVNIQGGAAYRGDPKNLVIQSIGTAAQKAENAAAVKLRYAGPTSYTEAGAKAAGEFNFQNGTNIGYASQQPGAPLIDMNTGKPVQVGAGGVITTTQTGTPNVPAAAGVKTTGNQTPADIARQGKIKEAESTQFVKYASEDITPKADAGAQISRIRKEQLYGPDGILNNAELAGVLQGQGPASAEVANIFRDIITGGFKDQADLSQRVNSLGLNQRQKDVVNRQVGLMLSVNPLTLRANAGPGAVSDAEQKANREANVDFMRQPLYSGLSLLTRDQFNKDLNVARAEFKAARPDLQNTEQFNSAWSGEKAKKEKEFDQIYAERAKYIGKYNKDGKNTGAIVDAYKYYPVPVFDTQTKTWDYGTEFSKKAARPKLNEFNK